MGRYLMPPSMKNLLISGVVLFLCSLNIHAQEITETNSDVILEQALEAYKDGKFERSLELTKRGLKLAPDYHDIRILQIRNYWALNNFMAADDQLDYLLLNAPQYIDVKPIVDQRINRFENNAEAIEFINKAEAIYPQDNSLLIRKAQILLKNGQRKEARALAMDLISKEGISGADRYTLQIVLNRSVSDEVGINYQFISFSEDYPRNDSWNSVSGEYQHNFGRTAVIGRVNYSDRGYDHGTLYELEAYPVFSDKFYAFTNVGFSNGEMFPDVRGSLSLFYNFAKVFEAEAGGRLLIFNDSSYFTGIIGLTVYQGKFYLNLRTFLGPERLDQVVQNYQGNVRYYFSNADNYLFLRIGSGISPDERTLFSQVLENPGLEAYYGNAGINFTLGVHHILQLGAGALYEDVTNDVSGNQFIGTAAYRYRF